MEAPGPVQECAPRGGVLSRAARLAARAAARALTRTRRLPPRARAARAVPWQFGSSKYMRYPNDGAGLPKEVCDIPEYMVDQYVEAYYLPKVKNLPPA